MFFLLSANLYRLIDFATTGQFTLRNDIVALRLSNWLRSRSEQGIYPKPAFSPAVPPVASAGIGFSNHTVVFATTAASVRIRQPCEIGARAAKKTVSDAK